MRNAETLDAKLAAASAAVKSADKAAESVVVSEAVRSAETLDAKVAAAGEAVSSAETEEQKKILTEALHQASDEALEAVGAASATSTATRRLNVVFSESAYNTIKDLAGQTGKTISDVVRDAIALQKWFIDVRRKGGRILVEERGRVREILNIR